jgi:hypothetical protein
LAGRGQSIPKVVQVLPEPDVVSSVLSFVEWRLLKDFVLLTEFSGANQKAGVLFLSRLTHFIPHVLTVRTQETSLP